MKEGLLDEEQENEKEDDCILLCYHHVIDIIAALSEASESRDWFSLVKVNK